MKKEEMILGTFSYIGMGLEILRNIGLILLMGVTVWIGSTGIGKLTYQPLYTASATTVVRVKGADSVYSSLAMASSMANVFGEVFQSDALKTLVEEEVGKEVKGTITCRNIEETNLLEISSTSTSPKQAYSFINSALKNYEMVSEYVFTNATLEIVQEPSIPETPSNVSGWIANRDLLTVLVMLGMVGLIILFYLLRYTVKNSGSAENLLDGEILGVIPYEWKKKNEVNGKKTKQSLLIHSPIVSMRYAEASRKMEARIEHHLRKNCCQSLLVNSVSENEGKSTIAANIALALAEKHKKVVLIDGDFRKPSQYKVFDVSEEEREKRKSLSTFLRKECKLEEVLCYNHKTKICELFQYHVEEQLIEILNKENLMHLMNQLKEQFDYIIIDSSPATAVTDVEIWMLVVDSIVSVVRQDYSDVRVINDVVDVIWQNGKDFVGFVLNGFYDEGLKRKKGYNYGETSNR